jgi:hypothetical protein
MKRKSPNVDYLIRYDDLVYPPCELRDFCVLMNYVCVEICDV